MQAFLTSVDEAAPANLEQIVAGLALGGFTTPTQLDKADETEVLAAFPSEGHGSLNPAGKAFVRRAIRKASRQSEAASAVLPTEAPPPTPREKLEDLFGVEVSAEAVAAALQAKVPQVDVQELLGKALCKGLPPSLLLDVSVWQALSADTEAAKKRGKTAFTYVDFTSKVLLPHWLPADAVGGKKKKPEGGSDLDPEANTSSLQALSAALQSAVEGPRSLRSIGQWVSIFLRYAPMAVSVEQLTWSSALAYMATVVRLGEQERLAKTQGWVAIRYDAALRQSWARRALQGDPDLDIPKECAKINKDVLDNVRAQLHQPPSTPAAFGAQLGTSSATSPWVQAATESALAKAGAAAQAVTRRAEQASRELTRAEQALATREDAMRGSSIGGGKGGKGGKANNFRNQGSKGGNGSKGGHKRKYGGWGW